MDISGTGTQLFGKIEITAGSGILEFNHRPFEVLVYHNSGAWTGTQNVDYQAITTDGVDWYALFLQCHGDGTLADIWYENFNGTGNWTYEKISASYCKASSLKPSPITFPALAVNSPPPTENWSLSGPVLNYTPGVGGSYIAENAERFELFPIRTVDCTKCGTPGWYELHSLFYDAATANACFGIIYMTPSTGAVGIGYSICLPTLDQSLDARSVQAVFRGPLSPVSALVIIKSNAEQPSSDADQKLGLNCPNGTYVQHYTRDNEDIAFKRFENIVLADATSPDGIRKLETLLDGSNLDGTFLQLLSHKLDVILEMSPATPNQKELKARIDKALAQSTQNDPSLERSLYICIPDESAAALDARPSTTLRVSGKAAAFWGQPTGALGDEHTEVPVSIRVDLGQKITSNDRVVLTLNASNTPLLNTLQDHLVTTPSSIVKNVMAPGGQDGASQPDLPPRGTLFTTNLPSDSPAQQVYATARLSDILQLAPGQKLTFSYQVGSVSAAATQYNNGSTALMVEAYSAGAVEKGNPLPESHSLNGYLASFNQGVGTHVEVGASTSTTDLPVSSSDTKNVTAWERTTLGDISTRSAISATRNEGTGQTLTGAIQDVMLDLHNNHFIGELVVQQLDPAAGSAEMVLKPKKPVGVQEPDPELVHGIMLGYERALIQRQHYNVDVGGSASYTWASQAVDPYGDHLSAEMHVRVEIRNMNIPVPQIDFSSSRDNVSGDDSRLNEVP
ncbi:unnamed protein product [Sphagnum jensenii]|uniref:Uncharacterized protein n=1 Tax=Sphagnum jensenii TaxID=128206 RepID=A0ABP0V6B7_9BRYO